MIDFKRIITMAKWETLKLICVQQDSAGSNETNDQIISFSLVMLNGQWGRDDKQNAGKNTQVGSICGGSCMLIYSDRDPASGLRRKREDCPWHFGEGWKESNGEEMIGM